MFSLFDKASETKAQPTEAGFAPISPKPKEEGARRTSAGSFDQALRAKSDEPKNLPAPAPRSMPRPVDVGPGTTRVNQPVTVGQRAENKQPNRVDAGPSWQSQAPERSFEAQPTLIANQGTYNTAPVDSQLSQWDSEIATPEKKLLEEQMALFQDFRPNPELKNWAHLIQASEPELGQRPVFQLLTGAACQLPDASLTKIISQSPLMQEVLAQDSQTWLNQPQPLSDLINKVEVSPLTVNRGMAFGLNLDAMVTPKQFFRSLGLDPQLVSYELDALKQRLGNLQDIEAVAFSQNPATPDHARSKEESKPIKGEVKQNKASRNLEQQGVSLDAAGAALVSAQGVPSSQAQPMGRANQEPNSSQLTPAVKPKQLSEEAGLLRSQFASPAVLPQGTSMAPAPSKGQNQLTNPLLSGQNFDAMQALNPKRALGSAVPLQQESQAKNLLPSWEGLSVKMGSETPKVSGSSQPIRENLVVTETTSFDLAAARFRPEAVLEAPLSEATQAAPRLATAEFSQQVAAEKNSTIFTKSDMPVARPDQSILSPLASPESSKDAMSLGVMARDLTDPLPAKEAIKPAAKMEAWIVDQRYGQKIAASDFGDEPKSDLDHQSEEKESRSEDTNMITPQRAEHVAKGPEFISENKDNGALRQKMVADLVQKAQDLVKAGPKQATIEFGEVGANDAAIRISVHGEQVRLHVVRGSESLRENLRADLSQLNDALLDKNLKLVDIDLGQDRQRNPMASFAQHQGQQQFSGDSPNLWQGESKPTFDFGIPKPQGNSAKLNWSAPSRSAYAPHSQHIQVHA